MENPLQKKIQMIDDYIDKLSDVISKNDNDSAEHLILQVVHIYENEITGIKNGLNRFDPVNMLINAPINCIADAELLKGKLENHKFNLEIELYKALENKENKIILSQTMQASITVSFNQTIAAINNLPSDILSKDEKEIINGKLASLSVEKNQVSKWEKVKDILKWTIDKGIQIANIVLPCIAKILCGT